MAALGLLLLGPSTVFAQAPSAVQPLITEKALDFRSISDLQLSPDGKRLAFVVTEAPKGSAGRLRHIWILEVASGEIRQFTYSAKNDDAPRWSPDGRQLAFLSTRGEHRQIYLIPSDGGEALPLTEGKRNIQSFEWSPGGNTIAFLAPEPPSAAEEKKEKDKDDARLVDKEDKRTWLWLFDVASRKERLLAGKPWEFSAAKWMPRGDRLIVSATNHPESDENTDAIYSVSATDGKISKLASPAGPFGELRVSPDGKFVAYIGCRTDGPVPHDLFLMPIEGGTARNLTAESLDRPIEQFVWRSDGSILAVALLGFRTGFFTITRTGQSLPFTGFSDSGVNPASFALSKSGEVVFTGYSASRQEELWRWNHPEKPVQISRLNEQWRSYALANPRYFRYKSFDGLEIEAALLTPPGFDGHGKLPLVVLAHGGPTGAWQDRIEIWGQLLAAHGFAVFYPNIRGSSGYGEKFIEMNRGDWGGADYRDLMAGVDELVRRGIGDPDRLGIGGWSYGGFMAEWAITQTDRFKAAVSGAGLSDLIAEFGTEVGPSYDEWFFGLPWEKPEGFLKSSPITYIRNARTPTLILQGETDVIDPLGQSQTLYRALKHYGVETDFVIYPREGHGLREEKHLQDRLNRIVAWFQKYLKP